jgi:hypothetical protein
MGIYHGQLLDNDKHNCVRRMRDWESCLLSNGRTDGSADARAHTCTYASPDASSNGSANGSPNARANNCTYECTNCIANTTCMSRGYMA